MKKKSNKNDLPDQAPTNQGRIEAKTKKPIF